LQRARPAFKNILNGNAQIRHYTTFHTANKLFEHNSIWAAVKNPQEREILFDEHIAELAAKELVRPHITLCMWCTYWGHKTRGRDVHARNMQKLVTIFKNLGVDVLARWRDTQNAVLNSTYWKDDPELREIAQLDMLRSFEDYSRVLERNYEDSHKRTQMEKANKERKLRDEFKVCLAVFFMHRI